MYINHMAIKLNSSIIAELIASSHKTAIRTVEPLIFSSTLIVFILLITFLFSMAFYGGIFASINHWKVSVSVAGIVISDLVAMVRFIVMVYSPAFITLFMFLVVDQALKMMPKCINIMLVRSTFTPLVVLNITSYYIIEHIFIIFNHEIALWKINLFHYLHIILGKVKFQYFLFILIFLLLFEFIKKLILIFICF